MEIPLERRHERGVKIGAFSDFLRLRLPRTFQDGTASKSLEIDQDNVRIKFSALNVDSNSARFDPLGTKSPPSKCFKFGYPLQNARFLLLSTNLARERLQIDTDLPHIITGTADELSGGYQHGWPWTTLNPKIGVLANFSLFQAATHTYSELLL